MKSKNTFCLIFIILAIFSLLSTIGEAQQCLANIPECSVCANKNQCTTCKTGFLVSADGRSCGTAIANCLNLVSNNLQLCNQCINSSYTLTPDKKNCGLVITNCTSLSNSDPTKCTQCNTNFSLTTSMTKCVSSTITNCTYYNDALTNTCDTCNTGYMLSTNKQVCGLIIANCDFLNSTSPTQC